MKDLLGAIGVAIKLRVAWVLMKIGVRCLRAGNALAERNDA
jgi:hypothetical protein